MDHYLDLKLLPDPEFPEPQLMSALLSKFHRALHDLRRNDIGISFLIPGDRSGTWVRTCASTAIARPWTSCWPSIG